MPSTGVSEEIEVVCVILESWALLELGMEGLTDLGDIYNLVEFWSLEIVTIETGTKEEVLYLFTLAGTGECESASFVGLVKLVDMDPSKTE